MVFATTFAVVFATTFAVVFANAFAVMLAETFAVVFAESFVMIYNRSKNFCPDSFCFVAPVMFCHDTFGPPYICLPSFCTKGR